ncbi:hypothetical protein MT068_001487 [Salmonella enterica]|nr:hypothetical protein [Salmonella enterica]
MSKLTELLKAGDVKYLQRDSWGNSKACTILLEMDVEANVTFEHIWDEGSKTPCVRQVDLTLDEALADDWEIVELDM